MTRSGRCAPHLTALGAAFAVLAMAPAPRVPSACSRS
jgi:hypothetical protein